MLEPGDTLGGYRIDRVLGQGGMGVVFEATQLSLDRKIALKVVAPHLSADATFRERFRREGLLQAAADHPHILPVYEAGEDRGLLFLAMRLVRGPNLSELIQQEQLTPDRSLALLGQVADALDSAHDAGMIHRDVKPQNVLVDRGDFALLADFGLTRALGDQGMTRTGDVVGSIHYISPEQIRGLPPSSKSDLYAFAAVLFQCLAGRPPFTGEADAAVIYGHMSEPPPLVSGARPELPDGLDAVVARGLAKDPGDRYPTARALVDAAAAALSSEGASTATPRAVEAPQAATRVLGSPRRSSRVRALALVGLAAGTAALAGLAFTIGNAGSDGSDKDAGFVGAGPIGLSLPVGWQRLKQRPAIPGLELADRVWVGPTGGHGGLLAGRTQARGSTLLPAAFRRSIQLPKKTAVRLGTIEAYRYLGVRGNGITGRLTLYAVPTSGGVVTLGCLVPPATAGNFVAACERVVATLDLSGVNAYPLGPSAVLGASLRETITSLDATRLAVRRILGTARTPAAQADAARELAGAFGSASRRLTALAVSPEAEPARSSVVDSLSATQAAYLRVARAADSGQSGPYAQATKAVTASEQRLSSVLRGLSTLGYVTRGDAE